MKILSIILTMVITLTIVSCYPRGDDDSVMGPGEKLVGTWIEDDTDTNVLYYIFGNDGTCTHGITNCVDPVTPWSKQGTWAVEREGEVIISYDGEPTQTLDYAVTSSSLTLDGLTYHTVGLSITINDQWAGTKHLDF